MLALWVALLVVGIALVVAFYYRAYHSLEASWFDSKWRDMTMRLASTQLNSVFQRLVMAQLLFVLLFSVGLILGAV